MTAGQSPIVAAGALCWRMSADGPEVLLIHRPRHQDVSLPKGKAEAGELLPATAVREVEEETGLKVSLGAPLGTVRYRIPTGRDKVVHYWSAEIDPALKWRFRRNEEVDRARWVPLAQAAARLTYAHDRGVVERFQERIARSSARTFALIAVRHGKALDRADWSGEDAERPLQKRGNAQARALAPAMAAFGVARLISSPATRCVATLTPTAELTRLKLSRREGISQDAWERGRADVHDVVHRRVEKRVSAAICSHGPVLPELLREIARCTESPVDAAVRHAGLLQTGQFSVLHLCADDPSNGIVDVEVHGPGA